MEIATVGKQPLKNNKKNNKAKALFPVGTYSITKEKLLMNKKRFIGAIFGLLFLPTIVGIFILSVHFLAGVIGLDLDNALLGASFIVMCLLLGVVGWSFGDEI